MRNPVPLCTSTTRRATEVDDRSRSTTHRVIVELAGWVTDEDVLADLEQSPHHQLHDYAPRVTHGRQGRSTISLTIVGLDLWTCVLTAMAVIRQSGYEPTSVQVVPLASRRAS